MCFGPPIEPATQKARNYVFGLKILMVAQITIIVLNFIAGSAFLRQGLFGLLLLLILYFVVHRCSYQILMIYIFMCLFFAISFMQFFLTPLQNQKDLAKYTGMQKFIYGDSILSFVYYVGSCIFCFYPYRQFKAIQFSENPALWHYLQRNRNNEQPQNNNQPVKQMNYVPDYGDVKYQKQKRNNQNGKFQVFQGQGVVIG